MTTTRIAALCLAGLSVFATPCFSADQYPNKPVRIVVPTNAGGASDYVIRPVAQALSEELGQTFVVDNRPGATGAIGMQAVAQAQPDGYTLVFGTSSNFVTNAAVNPAVPYDPIKDFAPVSIFFKSPFLFSVPQTSDIQSVEEFIKRAKAASGKISYASAGIGSFGHLLTEYFSAQAGIKLMHVPYKGSAPAMTDFVAGRVDTFFDSVQSSMPYVQSNKVRVLAIGSPQRSSMLPDVPSLAEAGYPLEGFAWWGLFAPAHTPPHILATLNRALTEVLKNPKVLDPLVSIGATVKVASPDESAVQLAGDLKIYKALVKSIGIQPE